MGRNHSRSRGRSRSRSPVRRKHYDDPRDRRRERRSPGPSGLLVRNIALSARPEDLRVPFERFGPVKDVYLPKNYYTGEPRGFGFVKFRYPEDAAEAKSHLNRTIIGGREIRIVFAEENRKTPQEMRRVTRTSSRGSHRRRSPSFSPRHRNRSYSRSPSPARRDSRDRGRRTRDDYNSPGRSRSVSKSISPRDDSRHISYERPRRLSRSISRSVSPRDEKNHMPNRQSPIHRENGKTGYAASRSPSPRRNSKSPARSPSPRRKLRTLARSPSPRRNPESPARSPSPRRHATSPARSLSPRRIPKSPARSPSPRRNPRSPARSPSPRRNPKSPARSRSRS